MSRQLRVLSRHVLTGARVRNSPASMSGRSIRCWSVVRLGAVVSASLVLTAVTSGCSGGGSGSGGGSTVATATPTREATATTTARPSASPTATATLAATVTPSAAATPTPTVAPTETPTAVPTTIPTAPATATPTVTATAAATPTTTAEPAPTEPPLTGPVITWFGVADGSGTVAAPAMRDAENRPVFRVSAGDGFILFVEGRLGVSRLAIGTILLNGDGLGTAQPDLQIVSSRDLGTPTTAVCDGTIPTRGGVPAIVPPRFDAETAVSGALNDLACRFKVFAETDFACTQTVRGNFVFAGAGSVMQFCTLVNEALTFPAGETLLSARLRDTDGNAGPTAEMVVRVGGE